MIWEKLKNSMLISLAIALVAGASGFYYAHFVKAEAALPSFFAALTVVLSLLPFFSLMAKQTQLLAAGYLRMHPHKIALVPSFFVACYLLFALGTGSLAQSSLCLLLAFLLIPLALLYYAQYKQLGLSWIDALAIFCIWIPFDLGLIKDIWLFPSGEGAYVLNSIFGVSYAVILFSCFRLHKDIGYLPRFNRKIIRDYALGFLVFCAVAIPFGFYTDFIHYNGKIFAWKAFAAFPGILLFIAIPEELLFRGLFQNFLTQRLKYEWGSIVLASFVFGLTHLNNKPLMDWRYVTLATIAGVVYGWAYHRHKNLTAAALIHATVDAVWIGYFMG